MPDLSECRTITVSIGRPADEVYAFLADPTHLPQWSFFVTGIEGKGDRWIAETPQGTVGLRFAEWNELGVLDHWVMVNPELDVYVPMRVVPNGPTGSEVLFTIFRLPHMSDEQYDEDVALVRTDLDNLKRLLEDR